MKMLKFQRWTKACSGKCMQKIRLVPGDERKLLIVALLPSFNCISVRTLMYDIFVCLHQMATDKLTEGIDNFAADQMKLEDMLEKLTT